MVPRCFLTVVTPVFAWWLLLCIFLRLSIPSCLSSPYSLPNSGVVSFCRLSYGFPCFSSLFICTFIHTICLICPLRASSYHYHILSWRPLLLLAICFFLTSHPTVLFPTSLLHRFVYMVRVVDVACLDFILSLYYYLAVS